MKMNNYLIILLILLVILLFLVYYYKYLKKKNFESFTETENTITIDFQVNGQVYYVEHCFEESLSDCSIVSKSTELGKASFFYSSYKCQSCIFMYKILQSELDTISGDEITFELSYLKNGNTTNTTLRIPIPQNT